MAYAVAEVEKKDLKQILGDDLLSRQSITVKDGRAFGAGKSKDKSKEKDKDVSYVLIEGNESIFKCLKDMKVKLLKDKKAEKVREKIKKEDDEAASGLGFIFSE
jgi:hypothetical protein